MVRFRTPINDVIEDTADKMVKRQKVAQTRPVPQAPLIAPRRAVKTIPKVQQPQVKRAGTVNPTIMPGDFAQAKAVAPQQKISAPQAVKAGVSAALAPIPGASKLFNTFANQSALKDTDRQTLLNAGYRRANLADLTVGSIKQGYNSAKMGQEYFKMSQGVDNKAAQYAAQLAGREYQYVPSNTLGDAVSGGMQLIGQIARQWTEPRTIGATAAAAGTAALAGQMGPQALLPEEVVTVPAAAFAAFKGSTALSNAEIEAGFAYKEMLDNGIDPKTARNISMGVGVVNGALEFAQMDELLKAYGVLSKSDATQTVAKRVGEEITRRAASVAKETGQEVAQEASTLAGVNLANHLEGKELYSKEDVIKRLGDTALQSALSFGVLQAPGGVRNVHNILKTPQVTKYSDTAAQSTPEQAAAASPVMDELQEQYNRVVAGQDAAADQLGAQQARAEAAQAQQGTGLRGDTVQQPQAVRPELHIDQRTRDVAGDKSVKAFQYDNPVVKPFYQEQAAVLLNDVRNGVKGQRFAQRGEDGTMLGMTGQGRVNSEPVERMLNDGMTYEQIERGLKAIINDDGRENIKSAKLAEMYLDEALSNGYQSMDGQVPVNYEYLDAKSRIAGAAPNALYQDAETIAGVQQEATNRVQAGQAESAQTGTNQVQANQGTRVNPGQTVVDVDPSTLNQQAVRYISRAAAKARVKYRVVDGLSDNVVAYIEDDTIVYNVKTLDNPNAMRKATAHEVYHSLLGTDEHSRLMDMAVDYYGGGKLSVEQMIAAKKAEYAEQGVPLNDHTALDEIGADFMEIALADERVANRILTEQPNLAQRILTYVRERMADFKAMRGLSEAEKRQYTMLRQAQRLYEQGLKAQGRQRDSQRRYQINQNFAQQIKNWVSGQMGENDYFDLGATPPILQQFGAKPLPVVMAQSVIVKINGGKHNIAWDEIARLPDQIAHPLAILKGSTPNSFVVLTDIADKSGKRVIAAIHLDQMQNRLRVNRVASLYGKKNLNDYIERNINEGKLVYPDKKIASTWFTSEGLQLPKLVQTNVNANLSITEDERLSNGLFDNLTPEQRAKLLGDDADQRYSIARIEGQKSRFEELLEQYGAIPEGEAPRTSSDHRTPQQTDPFNRVNRFARTAMEAEPVTDEVRQSIRDDLSSDISSGRFVYEPINNKDTLHKANQRLATQGYEQAVDEFRGLYSSGKRLNASDIALGERLIVEASKRGDTETATQLIADVAALGTEMGQAVQALRLIKRMTPEGRLLMLERTVNRINGKLAEEGKPPVALNPQYRDEMLRQETVEGMDRVQTDALMDISEQMPSTLADKINAWRYLSMLGNPRTHIRNIVGNAVFAPVRMVRDTLSFAGEQLLPAGAERTKSLHIRPEYRKFAETDYEQAKAAISTGGSKYDMFSEIERNKRIFRNPLVEKMRKWNENALEAEDMFFSRRAYVRALAGYMQANHLSPDYLQSNTKQSGADFQRAQNYAVREAQKATFRDYSGMASALNQFERKNAVTRVIGGAVMPFKKTPINILKRGVEYSPAGLAEGLTRGVYQVAKGKITPAEFIDKMTAGLTGSGILALGYFLASLGLLSAGEDDPQKKAAYDRALGSQNYAVDMGAVNRVFNLNLPDGTYTIDWMAPAVMPLMTGVELYNSLNTEYGDDVAPVGQVVTQLTKVINPVLETSMMQGLLDVMQSFQNGSGGQLVDMVGSMASSYGGQFVPTLAGQVARTVDGTKRSTYAPTNSPYTQGGERFGRQMMAKLPGASEYLEPQVDVWGREVQQPGGSMAARAVNNMFNPGLYKPNTETAVDTKLLALYDETGESKVLPSGIGKAVEYGDRRYPLKASEYTAMQKQVGSRRYSDVQKLQQSNYTKELDDSQMSNVIANLYEYRAKEAKAEYLRGKGVAYEDGAYWKAKEAEQSGVSPVDYFAVKQIFGGDYTDAKKKYDDMRYLGITPKVYLETKQAFGSDSGDTYDKARYKLTVCKAIGMKPADYQAAIKDISRIKADKDANGKTISNSKREKVRAYINTLNLSADAKRYLFYCYYPKEKTGVRGYINSLPLSAEDKRLLWNHKVNPNQTSYNRWVDSLTISDQAKSRLKQRPYGEESAAIRSYIGSLPLTAEEKELLWEQKVPE